MIDLTDRIFLLVALESGSKVLCSRLAVAWPIDEELRVPLHPALDIRISWPDATT